jgi:hypothetical protein
MIIDGAFVVLKERASLVATFLVYNHGLPNVDHIGAFWDEVLYLLKVTKAKWCMSATSGVALVTW